MNSAMYDSNATIEQQAIVRLATRHGVLAYAVSGLVHMWSWAGRDGVFEQVLDVVSTYSEARRVLGY